MNPSPTPTAPPRRRLAGRRPAAAGLGALLVLAGGHLVVDAYSSAYAPILAIVHARFDLTFAQVGWAAAVFAFSASIMQPVYGVLSDRLGSPLILVLAPGIAAIGLGALPFVHTYPAVLALLFIGGIGIAAYHPQGASQAAETLRQRPSLAMALFIGAGNMGFAIGPVLVAWTYTVWGWEGLWRVGVPGVLTAIFLLPIAPPLKHAARRRAGRIIDTLAAHWQPLLTMYLFVVVRGVVQLIYVGFLSLYLIERGMSVEAAGGALSLFLAAGSLGSITGGVLGDRFDERAIIRLSMIGPLPLFAIAWLLPGLVARLIALSAAFFVLLLSNPLTVVLAQSWVRRHRSTVSSLLMGFAWGIGGLVAPLFGSVADRYGLGMSLATIGVLPVIGALLAWRLPPRRRSPAG